MTEALIFLILFGIIYYLVRNSTYKLLFIAAILNVLAYPYTSETSVLIPGTIDFIVLCALMKYGDVHYRYQVGLLVLSLLAHIVRETVHVADTDIMFSSYEPALTLITIAQLLGAGYALVDRLFERIRVTHSANILFYQHNGGDSQACQKKPQKH